MSFELLASIVFFTSAGVSFLTGERIATIVAGVAGVLLGVILLVNHYQ